MSLAVLGGLVAGADMANNLINTGVNWYYTDKANSRADESFALQKEQYEYQKQLQQEIFNREDNAVQRRVADLKAAGLSPVLAAGSGANAGQTVALTSPKHSGYDIPISNIGADNILTVLKEVNEIKSRKLDIDNQKKQGKILDEQAESIALRNAGQQIANDTAQYELELARNGATSVHNNSTAGTILKTGVEATGRVIDHWIKPAGRGITNKWQGIKSGYANSAYVRGIGKVMDFVKDKWKNRTKVYFDKDGSLVIESKR